MNVSKRLLPWAATAWLIGVSSPAIADATREPPDLLKPWTGWALWNEKDVDSPRPYHDAKQALRLWPSSLHIVAGADIGRFSFDLTTFAETWVPLPGDAELWPEDVDAGGVRLPVVEHMGRPAVRLAAGNFSLTGNWRWQAVPQRIAIPPEIGILSLALDGREVPAPVWDAKGFLWLRRDASTEQTDKDFLGLKIHSLIEDGIPMWLHSELELIVAGKSREETLGHILPAGWKLSAVESAIPVAVDDAGRMKAQVRPGKWKLRVSSFRLDHPERISFAKDSKPATAEQLVAFHSAPELRLVEISGIPVVDVSQTQFPDEWREFPVYRWETADSFRMDERMRGMGLQKPEGLGISRELWLDEDGGAFTFRDRITGHMQQVWRLDVAENQELGSVRAAGMGQLITRNPQNGASGVEIRERELNLEATGRTKNGPAMPATGWRTDAAKADVMLHLPPGWRLFALFGADWVQGDWLTAWSLLDLFLLLVFTLAVFRLQGIGAAVLAFIGFGISYHEPNAPRYLWLVLLIPLALLRVVPQGWGRRVVTAGKWLTALALVLVLAPFTGKQIQQALYPQLENLPRGSYGMIRQAPVNASNDTMDVLPEEQGHGLDPFSNASGSSRAMLKPHSPARLNASQASENLQYDLKARIQTGPGVPEWQWRGARFGWNGPVTEKQTVRPVLIPAGVERVISLARVLLLLAMVALLLGARRPKSRIPPPASAAALVLLFGFLTAPAARAEFPDQELLETMRARLTEVSDAFPTAADIPRADLTLHDGRLTMDVEIHAATRTAVPLPGRLSAWAPRTVMVDGNSQAALRRGDGFLWVVLPEGIHKVRVDGIIADVAEWQWSWKLRPHKVSIHAPGWQVSGVKPGGVPEDQVFFTREVKSTGGAADYDRPILQTAVVVERRIELGLVWQVQTNVGRLADGGGAVSLRIPLLPGENVLTSGAIVRDGFIEVRLGAGQDSFLWQSELGVTSRLALASRADDAWVENWLLTASPVWNVAISGLAPMFDEKDPALSPEWRPWPGENVALEISRPEALTGATVTIDRASHEITLGKRQRTSSLELSLRSSLGEDFLIALPADAEATSLTADAGKIPVRRDGNHIIVPLRPGTQQIVLQWKQDLPLAFHTGAEAVRLPVESANINTSLRVPDDRWVLWAGGPLRGPAVRFWGILLGSLLAAWILGRMAHSPLKTREWMLLAIGLTQIPLPAALVVVAWLFILAWRGGGSFPNLPGWVHNGLQALLVLVTMIVLGIFISIVAEGLLGSPEMFISGNGSTRTTLRWFQARCSSGLPQPFCFSISIWWYRLLMLLWALWLAAALIRWLGWGWRQFNTGGCFYRKPKVIGPPPLPR